VESEERGIAEAIAVNLREMAMLTVPVVVAVIGEGGSGGALGLAVGDRVVMQEYAIYSVIPPEGCAAILWRDPTRKVDAADALKITASDLVRLGVIDEVVAEPVGGAHSNPDEAARLLSPVLSTALRCLSHVSPDLRLSARHARFRQLGLIGIDGL
jgi:acetyl-CoA carboxylase carboxyl transferase subunit alpha